MNFTDYHPINRRLAIRTTQHPDPKSAPSAYYRPRTQQTGAIIFPGANKNWPGMHEEFRIDPGFISLPWIRDYDGTMNLFRVVRQEIEIGGKIYDLSDNPRHIYALSAIPDEPYIIRSWVNYGRWDGVYHEKLWKPPTLVENPYWRGSQFKTRSCISLQEKWRNPNGTWVLGDENNYGYELLYAKDLGWRWCSIHPDGRTIWMLNVWDY